MVAFRLSNIVSLTHPMKILRKTPLVLACIFIFCSNPKAQTEDKLTDGVLYLSEYISSENITKLKESKSDIEIIDSVYMQSITYFKNDYSEALLALTFATLPFNKMPLKTPILNLQFELPLPSASDSIFTLKNLNLPTYFFWNSTTSDIDKTTHFFGNAYLSYSVSFLNLSNFIGKMVELFEYTFKIGGNLDERDLLINKLGSIFGNLLRKDNTFMPSQIINMYNIFSIYKLPFS